MVAYLLGDFVDGTWVLGFCVFSIYLGCLQVVMLLWVSSLVVLTLRVCCLGFSAFRTALKILLLVVSKQPTYLIL